MDEKHRQSQLDKLRQEQASNEDAFDQIAIAIARADVPISQDPAGKPTPKEQAATPADWINNYAEGMARAGKCSQEEAAQGIRSAFENRYGMSPEAYAEQFTPQKQDNSSALDDDLPKSAAKDDAIARAIEKVKDKVEDEQQRGQHDQGRGRG